DRERAHDHGRGLWRRVELSDDAHRSPRPAGADEAALEHEHVTHAGPRHVERDRETRGAGADDDGVGGPCHQAPTVAGNRRTGSPVAMRPGTTTRAFPRL